MIAGAVATTRVSQAAAAAREAMHRRGATHDGLTGLPNRALLHERLERAAELARLRPDYVAALLFLDFDGFKAVNDTLGHVAGDQLLRGIAARIGCCLRKTDAVARLSPEERLPTPRPRREKATAATEEQQAQKVPTAARLGGDEFCVFLPALRHRDDVALVANRLVAAFRRPQEVAGQEVTTTVSIGVTLIAGDRCTADAVLHDADVAMYASKRAGGDRWTRSDEVGQSPLLGVGRPADRAAVRRLAS